MSSFVQVVISPNELKLLGGVITLNVTSPAAPSHLRRFEFPRQCIARLPFKFEVTSSVKIEIIKAITHWEKLLVSDWLRHYEFIRN